MLGCLEQFTVYWIYCLLDLLFTELTCLPDNSTAGTKHDKSAAALLCFCNHWSMHLRLMARRACQPLQMYRPIPIEFALFSIHTPIPSKTALPVLL